MNEVFKTLDDDEVQPGTRAEDGSFMADWLDREGARLRAWNVEHPWAYIGKTPSVKFTLAELRAWKIDRSSGFLKVIKKDRKISPAIKLARVLKAIEAHGSAELCARIRELTA